MINNSTDLLSTVDIEGTESDITLSNHYGRQDEAKGPVEINRIYINYLPYDLTIVEPSGFRHVITKSSKFNFKGFIVRTIYTIDFPMVSKCKELFNGSKGTCSEDVEIIARVAQNNISNNHFRKITVGIDRVVSEFDLDRAGGSMYLLGSDVVISTLDFYKAPAHPRAKGSVSETMFDESVAKNTTGYSFGLGIEMINRRPGADPMYVFAAGIVRRIPVNKSKDREQGFYFTTVERDLDGENRQMLISKFYKLEDAKSVGIYKSEEEALTSGDVKLLKEEEITRLKNDAEAAKFIAAAEKSTRDKDHEVFMLSHNTRMADLAESNRVATIMHTEDLRVARHKTDIAEQVLKDKSAELIRQDRTREMSYEERIRKLKEDNLLAERRHDEYLRGYQSAEQERDRSHKVQSQQLEKEREGLKDYYENKNYKRKDSVEVLKIISTTITTIGVLALAYQKVFAK